MIVRISGLGQFELHDDGVKKLDELDIALTEAYHKRQREEFHRCLAAAVHFVQQNGTPVPHDQVVSSDVIMPPEDTTLEDAHDYMTNEGLTHPLPA